MNQIIEVIGIVASGKTTLAKTLAKKQTSIYLDIDLFLKNPFLVENTKNPKRWAFTTGLHFSFNRVQQIPLLVQKLKKKSVILDQGFDMGIYVYSKTRFIQGNMSDREWQFLLELHEYFIKDAPPIQTTIVLQISIPEIMRRIKKRGRPHEKLYTRKYLQQLDTNLREYVSDLVESGKRKTILIVSPNSEIQTFGQQNQELYTILQALWQKRV